MTAASTRGALPHPGSDAAQGVLADIAAGLDPVDAARRRGFDVSDPDALLVRLRRAASVAVHPSAGPAHRDIALAALARLNAADQQDPSC